MPGKFYRAVKTLTSAQLDEVHRWRPTMRLPTNVPYIVDNLWEYLRPANMPCRRHAVYVSPSPELAIECAARPGEQFKYTAYEVEISGSYTITQLNVQDARHHPDVTAILTLVKAHQAGWKNLSWASQLHLGMLFAPGCTKEIWAQVSQEDARAAELVAQMSDLSAFWATSHTPVIGCQGELFFELDDTSSYRLILRP